MSTVPAFASASEAMDMVHAGLGYLAAADATAMAADTQARCLQMLEQATAMGTAARASILAAFTSGQGYSADADYSPRAWLIHKTGITKGAAVGAHRVGPAGRRASAGRGRAGGRGDVGVGRPDDLHLDGQAAARTAGRPPTRSWSPRRRRGWTCGTWPGWPGRSTPGRCPRIPARTRTRRSRTGPSGWRPRSTAPGSCPAT